MALNKQRRRLLGASVLASLGLMTTLSEGFGAPTILRGLQTPTLFALTPGPDGFYLTGYGVRVKTVAFIDVKVYAISHYMKQLPQVKSKQAVIDMDTDKRFVWKMLRDVDVDKVRDALKDDYAMNGYTDTTKINQMLNVFSDLKEDVRVVIEYDTDSETTAVSIEGGRTVTIPGKDFMKGTWSIWFGKTDQPKLSNALISKL